MGVLLEPRWNRAWKRQPKKRKNFMKQARMFSTAAKEAHNSKVRMTYGKLARLNDSE
jgi:hypothetical protein